MGFWTRWEIVVELWVAASFCGAFAWGWVGMEGVTEDAMQDARDEGLDAECAPTTRAKQVRS